MQWSSAGIGTEACHARSPTKVHELCSDYSTSGPSSRRQAPVESESLSEISDPVPDAKGGKEEDRDTTDENGPLPVPKSHTGWDVPQIFKGARVPSGRRRRNRRCLGCAFKRLLCTWISASPWFTASCCRDGSLAVMQPLWVQKTSAVPVWEGIATQLTLFNIPLWQRSSPFCW